MDLKKQILDVIDVKEFVHEHIDANWSGNEQDKIECPRAATHHENGDDSSHSLSVNPETGAFNCFGCSWKGTSVIGMYTDLKCGGNFRRALAKLYPRYVRQTVSGNDLITYHEKLIKRPRLMQKIASIRGWNEDIIEKLRIGWDADAKRTTIPIYSLEGVPLDIRRHDTLYRAPLVKGKRVPCVGISISRTGDWFPLSPKINPLAEDTIWLLEGEPDVVLATQDGLNCVTVTGGAGAWKALDHERLKVFRDKNVIISLDNDKAGKSASEVIATNLAAVGVRSLKCVPVPHGKDITDFFLKHGGSAAQMIQYAKAADYLIKPKRKNIASIPLSETSKAEYIGKSVRTSVLISGKAEAPQAIPLQLRLTCKTEEYCANCPCKVSGEADHFVDASDIDSLEWLYVRDFGNAAKKDIGLPKACKLQAEVVQWQNLEQVTCIPSLSTSKSADDGNYSTRRGYYLGHGLESNNNYEVVAIPAVHPMTKESVLLIDKATGTYDSINQFTLDKSEVNHLRELFTGKPQEILNEVARMFANNHTRIYGRSDLHIAVDLAFHSPSSFSFCGVQLPKGSIELLLFGDTRCGKGQVAEGLTRYYDLGMVVSGENASFMGLCGGAQKAGDSFQLSWGAIPINNGRLVVIDEFSGLGEDVLGRLSRVRSEGIAEINKGGINSRTRANTRLIWIANPHKGREVSSYANGVTAIMELVKANEDVARFDLALVVQKGEVDINVINRIDNSQMASRFTQADLRKVVLWVWSRKAEHVVFTRECEEYIMEAANKLATIYSPMIPLIQGENARFKVAKLAAAVAGRCFSTEDGVFLRVEKKHAITAVKFMHYLYSKPSMGYAQFSKIEIGTGNLSNVEALDAFFDMWNDDAKLRTMLDGLLSSATFSVRELQDWCDVDANIAKKFAGTFVRCQATRQLPQGQYVKKPAFITYLKAKKKKLDG